MQSTWLRRRVDWVLLSATAVLLWVLSRSIVVTTRTLVFLGPMIKWLIFLIPFVLFAVTWLVMLLNADLDGLSRR